MRTTLRHSSGFAALAIAAAAALLVACATPVPPSELVAARDAYSKLSADTAVASQVPVILYEAKRELDAAESAWTREDIEEMEHMAYLSRTRVEIARQVASQRAAEADAKKLSKDRAGVRLEARTREVDVARVEADAAAKAAEEHKRRAADLEKSLADLKATRTSRGMILTLGDVLFDTGKAELRRGAMQNLFQLVSFLRENPERELLVEGHTDSVGTDDYNLDLSRRRAQAVRAFLIDNGIEARRIVATGFGEGYPIATNEDSSGRQHNRRVEVVILDAGQNAAERARTDRPTDVAAPPRP